MWLGQKVHGVDDGRAAECLLAGATRAYGWPGYGAGLEGLNDQARQRLSKQRADEARFGGGSKGFGGLGGVSGLSGLGDAPRVALLPPPRAVAAMAEHQNWGAQRLRFGSSSTAGRRF